MTAAETFVSLGDDNQLRVTDIRDLNDNVLHCVTTDQLPSGGVASCLGISPSGPGSRVDSDRFRLVKTVLLALDTRGDSLLNHFSVSRTATHPFISAVKENHLEHLFQDEASSNWLKSLQDMHFFCTADSWEETMANMPSVHARMVQLVQGSSQ